MACERTTIEGEDSGNNALLQREELEALSAIYGDDFLMESDNNWENDDSIMSTFSIFIRPTTTVSCAVVDDDNGILKRPTLAVPSCDSSSYVSLSSQKSPSGREAARLIISFQPGYPTVEPPIYQLSIPWLRGEQKQLMEQNLEELYLEHWGESIVYIWVEKIREMLEASSNRQIDAAVMNAAITKDDDDGRHNNAITFDGDDAWGAVDVTTVDPTTSKGLIDHFSNSLSFHSTEGVITTAAYDEDGKTRSGDFYGSTSAQRKSRSSVEASPLPRICTGAPLTDRKSTFQAHVAPVTDAAEVRIVLDELYQNKKIASATHNMYAFRILKSVDSNIWLQDCDDDGETQAGSRLLHLLQILDCRNVIVVVSRWYGGIQLHADRFKHINNVARQALVEFGFVSATDGKKIETDSKTATAAKTKGSARK